MLHEDGILPRSVLATKDRTRPLCPGRRYILYVLSVRPPDGMSLILPTHFWCLCLCSAINLSPSQSPWLIRVWLDSRNEPLACSQRPDPPLSLTMLGALARLVEEAKCLRHFKGGRSTAWMPWGKNWDSPLGRCPLFIGRQGGANARIQCHSYLCWLDRLQCPVSGKAFFCADHGGQSAPVGHVTRERRAAFLSLST